MPTVMLSLLLGVQTPIEQKTIDLINVKPPAIVQVVEPTLAEKIASNYYKCNESIEWIRADNAQCLAKTRVAKENVREPIKSSSSQVSSPGNGNDMTKGYCTWHVKNLRPDLPNGLGNANTWFSRAKAFGLSVGNIPQIGAVATTTRGSEGHVSFVLKVDGDRIYVSEMNVVGWNVVSYAWYSSSDYLYIY